MFVMDAEEDGYISPNREYTKLIRAVLRDDDEWEEYPQGNTIRFTVNRDGQRSGIAVRLTENMTQSDIEIHRGAAVAALLLHMVEKD